MWARYAVPVFRGFWVLSWCAGVALVPHGWARAEGPAGSEAAPEVSDSQAAAPVVAGPQAAAGPVVAGPRAPAVEVTTAKRVRHDVYFGMGIGFGGGNPNAKASGGAVAATGWARVGGRLREKVGLGGSLLSSVGGDGAGNAAGFTNILAEALFFPIKKRGLGLSVGLGFSSAWTAGILTTSKSRRGLAASLGVGYDFWLARRFNLGLWLRADLSGGGYGLGTAGTFGLGFSWY